MKNKITVITMAYNEEFLMPFFLRHYKNIADEIRVIYDDDSTDSTDETLIIFQEREKIDLKIIPFRFPDGMDDKIKVERLNEEYRKVTEGVVILVDVDEFVFVNRKELQNFNFDIAKVKLYHVFRHKNDKDLDINKPVMLQRRHGYLEPMYEKPIIAKAGLRISWNLGNHSIESSHNIYSRLLSYPGAHWANADPCFCIERRCKNRRDRQSVFNLKNGYTVQHHHCTSESILAECKAHENDPKVF